MDLDLVAHRLHDPGSSARIELSAPSSCRPPWFDTTMASAPTFGGHLRVVGVHDALQDDLAVPHAAEFGLMRSQSSEWSKASAVQARQRPGVFDSFCMAHDVAEGAAGRL
jgi:hypothetical protein